jgi:hypothetical protein
MKVWILDDSQFVIGFANGVLEKQPDSMCRRSICAVVINCSGKGNIVLNEKKLAHPRPTEKTQFDCSMPSLDMETGEAWVVFRSAEISLNEGWRRSLSSAIEYLAFKDAKKVSFPDTIAEEKPDFTGFGRYERRAILNVEQTSCPLITLEITDAYEGVELFVNGVSAGIQIAPPFRYNINSLKKIGKNAQAIVATTTLEPQIKTYGFAAMTAASKLRTPIGVVGWVMLYWQSA